MSVQSIRTMSVAAALALSAILCSCSVKEDRSGCPCYVCLSVDDFIRAGFTEALAAFSQGTDSHTTFNRIKAHKDILQILKRVLTCKI